MCTNFLVFKKIMDASASTKPDADTSVFFLNIDDSNYPTPFKQKNTVIKYTKLPDFDFDTKVSWPPHSYTLQPRLRRIISLDDNGLIKTNRSMKSSFTIQPKIIAATNVTKRKIVTISEDDENDLHPKFTKERRSCAVKMTNRSMGTDFKEKQSPNRTTSRLTNSAKYSKEIKTSAKTNSAYNKKEVNVTQNYRAKNTSSFSADNTKIKNVKEKETLRIPKSSNPSSKTSVSKNIEKPSESEKELTRIKNILYDNLKSKSATYKKPVESYDNLKKKSPTQKKPVEKPKPNKSSHSPSGAKVSFSKSKPLTVIHVPLDDKYQKRNKQSETVPFVEQVVHTVDCGVETDDVVYYKDAIAVTDPLPPSISRITQMADFEINTISRCESNMQTESLNDIFDSLEIPNVTLTKDKSEPKEDPVTLNTTSLPNLPVPPLAIASQHEEVNSSDISFCQSASYIISRATVTYTTRQKINFHVVGNDDDVRATQSPSPLDYPMNAVSVFKNELKNKNKNEIVPSDISCKNNSAKEEYTNCLNELKSLNCSYVFNKLMKPSDIISTIKVNNGLLENDYICEQFQRELNFIDSFFESLQYLESCTLADKAYAENNVENFVSNSVSFDVKTSEYDHFLSNIKNRANIDDTETMASKSLCLLNLLIRDEQRRAKNLLFVLKMREDALKDFTKSQILWLEKKKKHDNTDISTLKKKQRGALLKLQHECGEMQRMRKALLALSEKRKVALMKTKKNIEVKLKNNVDVEQIILGKKKLKRNTSIDRNAAPLKCFELSSSGCEESTSSRANSDAGLLPADPSVSLTYFLPAESSGSLSNFFPAGPSHAQHSFFSADAPASVPSVSSAEKCVQTGDMPMPTFMNQATDTAAENFVVVDGGYLNILFHNLTLPQIFSSGKQYEVNEEALRNIVNSANSHNTNLSGSDVVEKLMDQIKNKESESSSSTPSTARSLLEEFGHYYRNLQEEDKSWPSTPEQDCDYSSKVYEVKDSSVQSEEIMAQPVVERRSQSTSTLSCGVDNTCNYDAENLSLTAQSVVLVESECSPVKEPVTTSQAATGPLPIPVGAAAAAVSQPPDVPTWLPPKSTTSTASDTDSVSSQSLCETVSSMATLTAPVHVEAEELRRQQLAIEREIKALEQQQCRLLVVREIPDKPPPPYTPPTETRTPKLPRMFVPDENITEKVHKHITDLEGTTFEATESLDVFVKDFCQESLERHKQEQSDMPWDACNLLPQKPQVDTQKLVSKTSAELKEVLTSVTPGAVSGVSSRRSDHIDDILFTEWRRCEPEWTTLQTDEAIVKNQIFESIFQKILTDTIDEYKKTVQCNIATTD